MSETDQLWNQLNKLAAEFDKTEEVNWKNTPGIKFLVNNLQGQVPIYVSDDHLYVNSILVKNKFLSAEDKYVDELLEWNFSPPSGWGYGYSFSKQGKKKKFVYAPLAEERGKIISKGEPLLLLRFFDGYPNSERSYLALNQHIETMLDIHFVKDRNSYCKIDDLGDLENVVEISKKGGFLAAANFDDIEFYMYLTNSTLVRFFDITYYADLPWDNAKHQRVTIKSEISELHANLNIIRNDQFYLRGFQIIRQRSNESHMQMVLSGDRTKQKEYANFLAYDWKHKIIHECSCNPKELGNYFVESDKPFSTSPAFFKPEVLLRYKQNTEKYKIEERNVSCRGSWSLRYDINNEGQVHAFLCDLGDLPYQEQLYWKSFNETPKSGISERSYKSDFLGQWVTDYNPLSSLKHLLENYPVCNQYGIQLPIWEIPESSEPFSKITYVVTDSEKEWKDQILELAIIIVDRLNKKNIRKVASLLGVDNPSSGSIKLLKVCLEISGVDNDVVSDIISPLEKLWGLRSSGVAHFGATKTKTDLKKHYKDLLTAVDSSMRNLAELIENKYFDIDTNGKLVRGKN